MAELSRNGYIKGRRGWVGRAYSSNHCSGTEQEVQKNNARDEKD